MDLAEGARSSEMSSRLISSLLPPFKLIVVAVGSIVMVAVAILFVVLISGVGGNDIIVRGTGVWIKILRGRRCHDGEGDVAIGQCGSGRHGRMAGEGTGVVGCHACGSGRK